MNRLGSEAAGTGAEADVKNSELFASAFANTSAGDRHWRRDMRCSMLVR